MKAATSTEHGPTLLETRRPLIELRQVEKVFRIGKLSYRALRGVDLSIDEGQMVAIVGPSGSGKTTIMNMITGSTPAVLGDAPAPAPRELAEAGRNA